MYGAAFLLLVLFAELPVEHGALDCVSVYGDGLLSFEQEYFYCVAVRFEVGFDVGGQQTTVIVRRDVEQDFVNSWGLQRGDQVTFVTVQKRQGKYEVNYARIVLNPRNADGSGAPMTTEIVDSQGEFPCSNWKNQLNF